MSCGDCIVHHIGSKEFTARLAGRKGDPDHFPLSGSLELTLGCNLWCRHCYIRYPGAADGEMSTLEVKTILDKLEAQGVLSLLLTGGEVLERPDFEEIYRYAKRLGFLLTVFTNATRVDDRVADLFGEWLPRRLEITVYGHTEATYERVTGVKGSFRRYRDGVERLLARGLPLYLKMMVLRSNRHEFAAVRDWVRGFGLPFRFDGMVNPRLDGHRGTLRERLAPRDYVRLEVDSGVTREVLDGARADFVRRGPDPRAFHCGAGLETFHIDPQGRLHPCLMWRQTPYDALRRPLDGDWRREVADLRRAARPADSKCTACPASLLCSNCAATSALEAGAPGAAVPYYCALDAERTRQLRPASKAESPPRRPG